MLLTNQLDSILGQASKVRILRFLVKTRAELNGREIAAAVGLSHVKAHTALKELSAHGIVTMRCEGKSILYRLNPNDIVVKKLLVPLFEGESRLGEILKEALSKGLKRPSPRSVILFGSFASGRAMPDSDIDVLVVASKKEDIPPLDKRLEMVEEDINRSFGNRLSAMTMDAVEFRNKFRNKDKFIRTIAREGRVMFGKSINELIQSDD